MTDYYPLLSRAVSGLEKNTGEARRALYERARNALVAQLRGTQPPLPEADITRERLALEDAVRKVEADEARRLRTPPSPATPMPPMAGAGAPSRPPVPRPEDLRRQPPVQPANNPPPAGAPPQSPPRGAPPAGAPQRPAPPPPGPRPAVPPGMAPRPPESPRPPVPPGLAPRPPEQRPAPPSFERPAPPPPAPESRRPPEPPRAPEPPRQRAAPPPLPLEYPDEHAPPPPLRASRQPEYPQAADLDQGGLPPAPPPPPPPEIGDTQPIRRRRAPGPAPRKPLGEEKPANPARRGLIGVLLFVIIAAALAGGAFWQRDKISSLFSAAKNLAPSATTSNQPRQKASDRVGQDGQPAAQGGTPALVAQRVVLYEEDPANPEGTRASGSAIWRTETVSPGPGLAPELAVRVDIEIPERKFAMTMSIRRNTDSALPASHTVEILFNLPADFSSGSVDKVPGILMKEAEQSRGAPLAGLAVKVTNGFFLIGLSSADADMQRNMQLLKDRAWFDVPMVFANNRRAILAIEKGTPGERAFQEAFAAWQK